MNAEVIARAALQGFFGTDPTDFEDMRTNQIRRNAVRRVEQILIVYAVIAAAETIRDSQ
jgi:hypothetical protein